MTLFWMHLRKDIKKMIKIIFATGNADKMKEIREILSDLDAEIMTMKEAGIQAYKKGNAWYWHMERGAADDGTG